MLVEVLPVSLTRERMTAVQGVTRLGVPENNAASRCKYDLLRSNLDRIMVGKSLNGKQWETLVQTDRHVIPQRLNNSTRYATVVAAVNKGNCS